MNCRKGRRIWRGSPVFMGYPDATAFADELLRHLDQVRARYAEVFELVPELLEPGGCRAGTGFQRRRCRAREHHRRRCARSASATPSASSPRCAAGRPDMCARCGRSAHASCWLRCCRACWRHWPASRSRTPCSTGSTPSSRASPPACSCCRCSSAIRRLLDRIAAVLGAAPSLADHLASHPAALDGLLVAGGGPGSRTAAACPAARCARCSRTPSRSSVARCVRRTSPSSVATMEGRLDADAAGLRRAAIAEAALDRTAAAGAGRFRRRGSAGCVAERWQSWRWARRAAAR